MNSAAIEDLLAQEEEERIQEQGDRAILYRLLRYLRPYRVQVALAVVLLLLVSALGIAAPYLVKLAIDGALAGEAERSIRLAKLWRICTIYVAVLALTGILHYFQILVLERTGQRVMFDLRMQLFRHLLHQDMKMFDREAVGRLMTRLTSDIDALNELFTSGVVTVAMDIFTLLSIMAVMIWMDWKLALLSFAVIPPLFLLSFYVRARLRGAFRRIRVRVARINGFLQEHFAGIRVVQGFGQEQRRLRRFDDLNRLHTEAHLETVHAFAFFFPAVEILSTAAVVLLLWQGSGLVQSGAVTLGTLVAFVQYAQRFYRPISDLAEKFNILQGAMAASERIFEALDRKPQIRAPKSALGTSPLRGEIVFEDVHFAYELPEHQVSARGDGKSESVLRGLSFHVAPGERVAIVGNTGAGKSTVIALLSRFYDVDAGRILVDGVDVRDWDLTQLRRQIGVVLQDPRLFSGSLRENLNLWDEGIRPERVDDAAARIGLGRVLDKLPAGYQEELREGGSRLSTGERQLVAFVRALAHDPPVLVLDEATASIDSETEARLQSATEELLRGRTSLVIAHRLSTVRSADRILVLHHGRLVEAGSHDELMGRDGLYRRLVELQLRSEENGASRAQKA
jgi:ATP-binding cassette subfamily B protein